MRILCIGDVVGGVGRRGLYTVLPELVERLGADMVIANGENAAGGVGLTVRTANEMFKHGVHVITSGNHVWKYKEILPLLEREQRLLRPLNYPEGTPGRGAGLFETAAGHKVGVINLLGRAFMEPVPCPFRAAERAVERLREETPIIVVDFHAEATSEKRAMGWFLDGKVSALFGTHTHVATADEEVLLAGTGYITDIGMTGPHRSVIGARTEQIIERFLTLRPMHFGVAKEDVRVCGALFDIDHETGRARSVERVKEAASQ